MLLLLLWILNIPGISGHACINKTARVGQGFRVCYADKDTRECVSFPDSSRYNVSEDACQSMVTCVVCNYQIFQCAFLEWPLFYTKAGDCGSIDHMIDGVYVAKASKSQLQTAKAYLPFVLLVVIFLFLMIVK